MLSAIWMSPEDGSWPPEIDVAEVLGHYPWDLHVTNHYGTQSSHRMNSHEYQCGVDLSDDYHSYAMEWEPDEIRWYIDDREVYSSRNGVPSKPMYFILCQAIGPTWTGKPEDYASTSFPVSMSIDYVIISQRKLEVE